MKTFLSALIAVSSMTINAKDMNTETIKLPAEELTVTQEWDKVFPKSEKVEHKKVTFPNRYGITLVADIYMPKDVKGLLPAVAVCGPFGAVKSAFADGEV